MSDATATDVNRKEFKYFVAMLAGSLLAHLCQIPLKDQSMLSRFQNRLTRGNGSGIAVI